MADLIETQAERSLALDALRGLAILLMVLSGSISFGDVLPAWMYHAQVPPPNHIFNPNLAGITWVDIVFPFFLFSMGVALPLSLGRKLLHDGYFKTTIAIFKRFILLIFFAIFTYHARAWTMAADSDTSTNLLSIGCFALLFLMFSSTKFESKKIELIRKSIGFALAIAFLAFYPFSKGFDVFKSDIIIVVLANMALFGALIWIFTKDKPMYRLAILPFIMAVFLSGKVAHSWTSSLYNWSPLPWAYTFYYLKYLFIIIPGTIAGDWLLKLPIIKINDNKKILLLALLPLALVVLNITFLFTRSLMFNLLLSTLLSAAIFFVAKRATLDIKYLNFFYAGIYLLFLGLFFEAYEGGIKKDFSTYSYYFVSSGFAFLTLISFLLLEKYKGLNFVFKPLISVGKNPMIAYTAGNLFLLPLLRLTHTENLLNQLNTNAYAGFARGLIFTGSVALITIIFSRVKVFWKT